MAAENTNASFIQGISVSQTPPTDNQVLTFDSGLGEYVPEISGGAGDMTKAVYDPAGINEQLIGLTATQTLTNKTLTNPVISSISNTGTLTLPTSTDTLVGRSTIDTFTNKSGNISQWTNDSGFTTNTGTVTNVSVVSANGLAGTVATSTTTPAITLSTTITGVLKGNGTAISAAVAGTDFTTPSSTETFTNKSGNISQWTNDTGYTTNTGTVTPSSTDTFTNKTFDANATGNSLSNVDVADLANGVDGELITWDSVGAPATVAVGTSTQVLTSNGVGAAPTFQDAAGGGGASNFFSVRIGTSQTITTSTVTVVDYDTELFDIGSNYNITNKEYTAPNTAKYFIGALYRYENPGIIGFCSIRIYVNGSIEIITQLNGQNGIDGLTNEISVILDLTAGDTVQIRTFQTTGGNEVIGNNFATAKFYGYQLD